MGKLITCPDCEGTGICIGDDGQCERCSGEGEIEVDEDDEYSE